MIRRGRSHPLRALAAVLVLASLLLAVLLNEAQASTRGSAAAPITPAQLAIGKKVYVSSGCGKCHTMKAANSKGTIGPNLDQKKPSLARVVSQVTSGGGFMPSFGGKLSKAKITAVAAYVFKSTH